MNVATAKGHSTRRPTRRLAAVAALVALACALLAAPAMADPAEEFGVQAGGFSAAVTDAQGNLYTQAGGHPYAANTRFVFNTRFDEYTNREVPVEGIKDVIAELPAGFTGDPRAATLCPQTQLFAAPGSADQCPASSQVGQAVVDTDQGFFRAKYTVPVYNVQPEPGQLAVFGFAVTGVVVHVVASVRSDGDFGLTTTSSNLSQQLAIYSTSLTFWGVPADPSHDPQRGQSCYESSFGLNCERGGETAGIAPRPFLTNPTNCQSGPPLTTLLVDSWGKPGIFKSYSTASPTPTGCAALDFSPTVGARATTDHADAPSGLDFGIHLPQHEEVEGLATAQLKDVVVTLPPGLTVNAAAANGLGACDPGQIGLTTPVGQAAARFTAAPATCPNASKLGTVEAVTPVLDHPLQGAVYLASQERNPFGSLLAIYLAIEDPVTGLIVKLPGEVAADPVSGQLTASFRSNPQLPVEDLKVSFFKGDAAALKTPATCGTYTTTAALTPWTSPEGADAIRSDSFPVSQGAAGGPCAATAGAMPNAPTFSAGTITPTAGAFSPFVLKLARADGTQQIQAIDTTLPKGLLGKLAGVGSCSDAALTAAGGKSGEAEQAAPSCPAASQVGTVEVGAGAGPSPFYAQGKVYLAGPYKGAPLSLAIITPAVAGPFDLGNVVVRAALDLDPETTQLHAVSDPIPSILKGIPLDVRSIVLKVDRSNFTLNPTACAATSVLGTVTSTLGQSVGVSNPFAVGGCGRLAFGPHLKLALAGGTRRAAFPALTATLTQPSGQANIGRVAVTLPHSEFLEQSHIRTICTRVQFNAVPRQCPDGSVYGYAEAVSPLLDYKLVGPVYLRSSDHQLPDLVAALGGPASQPIEIDLVGRIDSVRQQGSSGAGIRNSFEMVPDAPVSKFVLRMRGGQKGLLVNSTNLCKARTAQKRATVKMVGQNAKRAERSPVVADQCGKKKRKGAKPARGQGKR